MLTKIIFSIKFSMINNMAIVKKLQITTRIKYLETNHSAKLVTFHYGKSYVIISVICDI